MFDVVCPRCLVEAGQRQTMAAEKPEVKMGLGRTLSHPEHQAGDTGDLVITYRCPRCPCQIELKFSFRVLAWK